MSRLQLQTCDACGGPHHPDDIDRTTLPGIEPIQADICRSCQFVQRHELPDDQCARCGDPIDGEYGIELEYPLGPGEIHAVKAARLCGGCAGWIACDINYDGLRADEEANEEFLEIVGESTARHNELEAANE